MSHYHNLLTIYEKAGSWKHFLKEVSHGPGKWTLLQALEEGWGARVHADLCERYKVPAHEVEVLIQRYRCLVRMTPMHASAQELAMQLSNSVDVANKLRAYFRYAYYAVGDDPDEVFIVLDEHLTQLGSGTPTREECARAYTTVTGKHANSDVVVLAGTKADELANHLAAEIEDIQKRLPGAGSEVSTKLVDELEKLNRLHIELTGRNVIDKATIEGIRGSLS